MHIVTLLFRYTLVNDHVFVLINLHCGIHPVTILTYHRIDTVLNTFRFVLLVVTVVMVCTGIN